MCWANPTHRWPQNTFVFVFGKALASKSLSYRLGVNSNNNNSQAYQVKRHNTSFPLIGSSPLSIAYIRRKPAAFCHFLHFLSFLFSFPLFHFLPHAFVPTRVKWVSDGPFKFRQAVHHSSSPSLVRYHYHET